MDDFDSLDQSRSFGEKLKRYTKVSSSAVGIVSRLLGEEYFGLHSNKESHAAGLKTVLGDLKGPIMKAAQLLSSIPGALPEEYTQELIQLQSNAPPMGWLFAKRRMAQELGADWQHKFHAFNREASAAASLGQVHKAVHLKGQELACKLQYPDMASIVHDDLHQLKIILSLYEIVSKALNTNDVFEELKERLAEELDYVQEAKNIGYYQQALASLDYVKVPSVYSDLSTQRLLTMSWLEGKSLLTIKDLPLAERNEAARRMFWIWYLPFYRYGLIHGDPHLGNYTVRDDLSINLLDFGCIRLFKGKFIQGVIDLYRSLYTNDEALGVHAYETWGFTHLTKATIHALNLWARFLYDPLLEDKVRTIHAHHGPSYGREMAAKVHKELHKLGGVRPPREFVIMDRAAVGMGAVFMHLQASLNWHQEYEKLIEGFEIATLDQHQAALK